MSGSVPGWDDPVGPQDAADSSADADVTDETADDGGTQVAVADPTGTPTDAGAGDDGGDDPGADDPPGAAPAETAAFELPKAKHTSVDNSCGKDPGVGQKLKNFKLATSDGKSVSNGTYRGRVLVVNFWGTWCKPCLKELPEFDQLFRRYRKFGMALLAIATDEDAEPVNDFKNKRKLAAKLAIGGEDYAGQYSSPQFPFTFVVDTHGTIKASYRGYKPKCMGKLEADIRKELEKRASERSAQ
jgi:peroxiredoxin